MIKAASRPPRSRSRNCRAAAAGHRGNTRPSALAHNSRLKIETSQCRSPELSSHLDLFPPFPSQHVLPDGPGGSSPPISPSMPAASGVALKTEKDGKPKVRFRETPEEPRPAKRSRHTTSQGRCSDEEYELSPEPRPGAEDNEAEKQPFLACPFYKSDCQKYNSCLRYGLRRVKDVKQHVNRRHRQPAHHCPRCWQVFRDAKVRDQHIRDCKSVTGRRPFSGISEEQRQKLHSSKRGMSIMDQWFAMREVIFPGRPRPQSCYPRGAQDRDEAYAAQHS